MKKRFNNRNLVFCASLPDVTEEQRTSKTMTYTKAIAAYNGYWRVLNWCGNERLAQAKLNWTKRQYERNNTPCPKIEIVNVTDEGEA